ncbi:MAG: FAD:protein FMN transferase [Planctomycetaceae bacterium]|nr:FAD:protein FMN transferase [Planctomycetaceae bacterium]
MSSLCCWTMLVLLSSRHIEADERHSPEQQPLQRFEFLQIRMAIPVRITVYAADEPTANQATQAAYARFKELDRLLSHYDPDSELSKLCKHAKVGESQPVSRELLTVLAAANRISRQTDGAFDVTVGPLMDLWRKSRRQGVLPSEEVLADARRSVGYQNLLVDSEAKTVTFDCAGVRLDLGGIAKGYAADEALRVLRKHGVDIALIDAGGDIVAGAPPPGKNYWRIGIAPLDSPDGTPTRFLKLKHAAVATSGDAAQFVEIEGVRYSHILDPHTGLGLTTHSSVTVIAPDGITADAWASAISVLGAERGVEKLTRHVPFASASVVSRHDSELITIESTRFSDYDLPDTDSTDH